MVVKWKSDFAKFVISANFKRRGWQEVKDDGDDGWNIYWASVGSVRNIFAQDSFTRLRADQLINHFPNHYELTRKDLMLKNINRYVKQARKEGRGPVPDLLPATYALPQDYALFVEECRRNPACTYIMKPVSKAQGKGIFLINKLSQVKRWSTVTPRTGPGALGSSRPTSTTAAAAAGGGSSSAGPGPPIGSMNSSWGALLRSPQESYVVSRYVDNPLLLGGKKFDLRLYVLVVSYRPLVVYMSRLGFARFCNVKYTTEVAELDNMYVHLTNVAVQKQGGSEYNESHGNKWSLDNLRLYLEATRGTEEAEGLFTEMKALVIHALKAVQQAIINDKHCFELYGFDVIIDSDLKPWLIEVNASPSLTTTSKADRLLKFKVISDVLEAITPPAWVSIRNEKDSSSSSRSATAAAGVQPSSGSEGGGAGGKQYAQGPSRYKKEVGSMELICDETQWTQQQRGRRMPSSAPRREGSQTHSGSSSPVKLPSLVQQPRRGTVLPG